MMEDRELQEDMVLAGAHLQGEDFEQVEKYLWEEYFKESSLDNSITPEESLIRMRMEDGVTALAVFAIINLFFMIFLFCGWHISIGLLGGSCFLVGCLMATILMCQACGTGYDENHLFVQELLVYFPVNARRLQKVLFTMLLKYVGIQAGIICFPLLLNMVIDFSPYKFMIALMAMVLPMLTVGTLIILGSMSKIKAEK